MKRTSFFALLLLGSVLAIAGAAPDMRALSPAPAATSAAATLPAFPDAPPGAKITQDGWFAPVGKLEKLSPPEHPSRVFVIPIREEITEKTWDALQRKAKRCRQSGADMIIFDMDTWGGLLMSGLDINRFLKANLNDIYTVCYVRTRAISAGAMIAMACNEIVVTPVCDFGDCAPIAGGGGTIAGVEREKLETVIRNEFRESARINGYSSALSQAMVSSNTEVWLIREKQTAQLQYVLAEEWQGRVDAPSGATTVPTNSAAQWKLLQVVKPQGRLLTMHATEAIAYGFAAKEVTPAPDDPYQAVCAAFGAKNPPTVLEDTWSESLVEFLTSSGVTSILVLVGIVGIYIEFQTPGHIVPGVVGGLAFVVLFGSRFLIGLSDWWPIAMFIAGLLLILLELLVFTGHMVWGISGLILCLFSLGALFLPNSPGHLPAMPSTPLDWSVFTNGLLSIGVAFVLGMIAMIAIASYLQKIPIAGRLILADAPTSDKPPAAQDSPLMRIKPGDQGVVHSMCRPVGKVRFGNDIVDAATEGEVLAPGQKVRVLRNDGNRIIIDKIG
jgi:membrane-bound serine protease (ClpP class)